MQWYTDTAPWIPIDFAWRPPKRFRAVEDDSRLWHAAGDSVSQRDYDGLRAPLVTGDGRWIDHRADADGSTPFVIRPCYAVPAVVAGEDSRTGPLGSVHRHLRFPA